MSPFFVIPALKVMFGAKRPKLNISEVMQSNKVLLVNLKETSTDQFIGSLIVSKIQQATFGRRYIPEKYRTPFYLYIDECSTIIKYAAEEFDAILLRARKYKLCLTIANQHPNDPKLPTAIQQKLPSIHTKILFNLKEVNALPLRSEIEHPPAPLTQSQLAAMHQYQEDLARWKTHRNRVFDAFNKVNDELDFLRSRLGKPSWFDPDSEWGDLHDFVSPERLTRLLYDAKRLKNEIINMSPEPTQPPTPPSTPPFTIAFLNTLPQFRAVAIVGNQVTNITTPQPLGRSSASYAKWIKKRSVQNYSCNTAPAPHHESTAPLATPDDDIAPTPPTDVPPNPRQKTRPRNSR